MLLVDKVTWEVLEGFHYTRGWQELKSFLLLTFSQRKCFCWTILKWTIVIIKLNEVWCFFINNANKIFSPGRNVERRHVLKLNVSFIIQVKHSSNVSLFWDISFGYIFFYFDSPITIENAVKKIVWKSHLSTRGKTVVTGIIYI